MRFLLIMVILAAAPLAGAATSSDPVSDSRYGPFSAFDVRSSYGKGVFPEPFLVDDSDLEVNEVRLDWFHQESGGQQGNTYRAEFEKGFGLMTVELEAPYLYNTQRVFDRSLGRSVRARSQGFDNVSIGARNPVFQYVSPDEWVDATFGVGVEAGIPTNSPVSKNAEVVPKLFADLRAGDHFTLQAVLGYSYRFGPKPDGGSQTFEYGLVLGWSIPHDQLPLPGVLQGVPLFELRGNTLLNSDAAAGGNALLADAGFRLNLRPIGPVQPRLGVAYVFPIDQGGRDQLRWGVFTSLVFEF